MLLIKLRFQEEAEQKKQSKSLRIVSIFYSIQFFSGWKFTDLVTVLIRLQVSDGKPRACKLTLIPVQNKTCDYIGAVVTNALSRDHIICPALSTPTLRMQIFKKLIKLCQFLNQRLHYRIKIPIVWYIFYFYHQKGLFDYYTCLRLCLITIHDTRQLFHVQCAVL